jgi:cytochrome P450
MQSPLAGAQKATACPHPRQFSLTPPPDRPLDEPEYFAELRHECPVSRVELSSGKQPWLFTRFDDVKAVLADPRFSSEAGRPNFPFEGQPGGDDPIALGTLIRQDPPLHTALRRMVVPAFTPKAVATYAETIAAIIEARLDAVAALPQPVDLVEHFAVAVPSDIISMILGVPAEDGPRFQRLTERFVTNTLTPEEIRRAVQDFVAYCRGLVDAKRAEPKDDLVSRLITDRLETGEIDMDRLLGIIILLVFGGHDTTAGLIGLGIFTLLKHPGQLALLRSGDRTWQHAVEEMVRIHSVARSGPRRIASEDLDVNGFLVREGEGVIASVLAGNHDEERFGPSRFSDFEIPEKRPGHLGFGFGPHQCLGQNLARAEVAEALRRIFERFPLMELVNDRIDEVKPRQDRAFWGLRELLVNLHAGEQEPIRCRS